MPRLLSIIKTLNETINKIQGEAMNLFLYIIIFIIGTLFGSFFTLAVYRIPLKKDITHERSYCPNCNHKLSFLDMIPILSYLFLGGKCRYCKQKIRIRYLLLEVLSGIVFVLFAMSIKLNVYSLNIDTLIYFVCGLLYFASLFIIAGIDKEKHQIQKSVLLFGYIVEAIYIIYLYIVEKDPNIYRYVIYFAIVCILIFLDIILLRKKIKNSYVVEILMLCMLFLGFTYEGVTILTITYTLIVLGIYLLLKKVTAHNPKSVQGVTQNVSRNLPIGFYLCITNIVCFIIANYYIFK